jgi:dihydroxyacetone kinase
VTSFVNDPTTMVLQAFDGLVRGSGGRLARLDGYPDVKVVLRADSPTTEVSVVSGGGAGHEPAHAGFVGTGLLAAAVSGEVFASPSAEAVLAAIRASSSEAGCLLVVKNYTGDRLNFGLAAQRARAAGVQVEMVIVADDVALRDIAQPRGIAGTLFVHKVAGAAAQAGASLSEVAAMARRVATTVRTVGVSASGVNIPFRTPARAFPRDSVELGLGIHGEPGRESVAFNGVGPLIELVSDELAARLPGGQPVALLVNNLGGVSALEMAVITEELLTGPLGDRVELLTGPGALMTSLSMKGFSVSALPLDGEVRSALLAPSDPAAAWPGVRTIDSQLSLRSVPDDSSSKEYPPSADPAIRALLQRVCGALQESREDLDALDAKVGDGDTGSTFASAARRIAAELDALPLAVPADLCARLSQLISTSMGGSSGVLLSIAFASLSADLALGSPPGPALSRAIQAIQQYGGASLGDRTMLDALIPATRALATTGSLVQAASAAAEGAESTADMPVARAGRSSYVGAEHLTGTRDPGAAAIAVIFSAMAAG